MRHITDSRMVVDDSSESPYDAAIRISMMSVITLVRLEGFEPPTLGSVDRCSNPLSYSRVDTGSRF